MATYYVSNTGNNGDGLSWDNAKTTLQAALTIATSGTDVIKIDKDHTGDNAIAANLTLTAANNVAVICVDKDNSDALAEMGTATWIGSSTTSYDVLIAGAYRIYFYGVTFRVAGASGRSIAVSNTDLQHAEYENCYLWLSTTGLSCGVIVGGQDKQAYTGFKNCTFRFGHASQYLQIAGKAYLSACTLSGSGTIPTTFIYIGTTLDPGGCTLVAEGCDFSALGAGTLFGTPTTAASTAWLVNCRLGSGFVVNAAQTSLSQQETYLFNCSSGDQHYHIGHYNALGSTVCDTGVYANDGAQYDGTNRLSWKITTTAYASIYTPYVSPWIDRYHAGTSAITPYLECLRNNSSGAKFRDDQVWSNWSYQGTSGYPLATFASDRMTLLGTPADQEGSGKTASDWTGETGTPGLFKIGPAAITPAEIGHLRARIVVGEPSVTVYVDPQIRGTA